MNWPEAEAWIGAHSSPVRAIELVHERPWASVWRVTLAHAVIWFKACSAAQAFEPRLTAKLHQRWPGRVSEVLAKDDERRWLLLADAGTVARLLGNPPELWQAALPRYAELQQGEAVHAADHLQGGVPDLRQASWEAKYEDLVRRDLPLEPHEVQTLVTLRPRFAELCEELQAAHPLPDTIQHDDLHMNNLFLKDNCVRVLDWGDSSISHPFISLVVTFRFLEEFNHLPTEDAWFARLRDAYLEPWGGGLVGAFALALRVGGLVHCLAWARQRDALPVTAQAEFAKGFRIILRRAIAQLQSD